jgi:hypothetical protein
MIVRSKAIVIKCYVMHITAIDLVERAYPNTRLTSAHRPNYQLLLIFPIGAVTFFESVLSRPWALNQLRNWNMLAFGVRSCVVMLLY